MVMSKQKKKEYAKQKNAEGREAWLATIEEAIANNDVPWRKPWKGGLKSGSGIPVNLKSNRAYRGGNVWGLYIQAMCKGWTDLRFGTRKNLIEKGYSVKGLTNGTGCFVAFYKPTKRMVHNEETGEDEEKKSWVSRWYEVWCVEQCENYEPPTATTDEEEESVPPHEMMKHFDSYVVSQDSLTLKREGNRAFYRSTADLIQLPKHEDFTDSLGEVMTAFHEAAHSTGHGTRLSRPLSNGFGSSAYAMEELVAELTSMLTVLHLGGDFNPDLVQEEHANNTAYLKNWLNACKEDKGKALSMAFSEAQKATDYILDTIEGGDEQ